MVGCTHANVLFEETGETGEQGKDDVFERETGDTGGDDMIGELSVNNRRRLNSGL